jgi:hypothetical protein
MYIYIYMLKFTELNQLSLCATYSISVYTYISNTCCDIHISYSPLTVFYSRITHNFINSYMRMAELRAERNEALFHTDAPYSFYDTYLHIRHIRARALHVTFALSYIPIIRIMYTTFTCTIRAIYAHMYKTHNVCMNYKKNA